MEWLEPFHEYLRDTSRFWVEDEAGRYAFLTEKERQAMKRKKQQLKERGAQIVKTMVDGQILKQHRFEERQTVDYWFYTQHLIKQNHDFYIEEGAETRRALFQNGKLVSDEPLVTEGGGPDAPKLERGAEHTERVSFYYRRFEAVRYADQWWNTYNPNYRSFEVDCTNYVSQCLRAGEAPMTGHPNRGRGWWYTGNNWSYSWSVAHALRWYLPGAKTGLRAQEMPSADRLIPGDIICYDFEGDGHWDHNTIVTAKDMNGMPLVNAHTVNCRKRYWAYEDSTAWTSNIKYKFYHIVDDE